MILISNDFCHKRKMYNFDSYNVLLVIATNIAVLLMTASVLQRHHIWENSVLRKRCIKCVRSFILWAASQTLLYL